MRGNKEGVSYGPSVVQMASDLLKVPELYRFLVAVYLQLSLSSEDANYKWLRGDRRGAQRPKLSKDVGCV